MREKPAPMMAPRPVDLRRRAGGGPPVAGGDLDFCVLEISFFVSEISMIVLKIAIYLSEILIRV